MFENFLYRVLMQLRKDRKTRNRRIVVYLDNARTHKSPMLVELAKKTRTTFLYSPQYSPWLMSVEQFHNVLKQHMKRLNPKPKK
jgi:transposase